MNPLLIDLILKEKKQEAAEHARHCRLIRLYNRANPHMVARLTLMIGKLLVTLGHRLQASANRHLGMESEITHEQIKCQ
ncbi:MAG: hypothetical protein ACI8ZB_002378 [Desulforhopalus sp.]|jgi:hypothetical protein